MSKAQENGLKMGIAEKTDVMLVCENLHFRYNTKEEPVFSQLSLTVKKGEVVLLMGPSGCGKSTLAYCLAGLYPEYAGEMEGVVWAEGEALASLGPARRARTVSILFQNPDNQFCMDRVDHEVLFALENINYEGNLQARTKELLELVGLADVASRPIYTLSGGMKQKLALCTALATEAKMLILDEPFANLDPKSCASLAKLLQKMKEQGMTLFIVDHRLDWWKRFLSRVILMEKSGNLDEHSILPEALEQFREVFEKRGLFLDGSWLGERKPPAISQAAPFIAEAKNLTLLHGKKPFLKDLSFQIKKGSVTALVGSCGSGKTTLLQTLAGIGTYCGELHRAEKAGLVFQNPRFQFLTLSVEEEVLTTLRIEKPKAKAEELQEEAEQLLDEFGLLKWRKQSPYALSQGQQRRLALLAMLAGNRTLMLLDEPTYAQDERSTRFILDLLERRVAGGLTVVMATHDLELAKACANEIWLLENESLHILSTEERERLGKGEAACEV